MVITRSDGRCAFAEIHEPSGVVFALTLAVLYFDPDQIHHA